MLVETSIYSHFFYLQLASKRLGNAAIIIIIIERQKNKLYP
jgi:hypothetical protein